MQNQIPLAVYYVTVSHLRKSPSSKNSSSVTHPHDAASSRFSEQYIGKLEWVLFEQNQTRKSFKYFHKEDMYFKQILYIVKSQLCIVELWFLVVTSRSYDAHCRALISPIFNFPLSHNLVSYFVISRGRALAFLNMVYPRPLPPSDNNGDNDDNHKEE